MRRKAVPAALSERAPTIVIVSLCSALIIYWAEAPVWLSYALAVLDGSVAVAVMAARERRPAEPDGDDTGSDTDPGWISRELEGKGSAPGSYLLGFFGLVTITLTGFHGPYAAPAWAALALAAAWGIANARRSSDESSTH